MVRLQLPIHLLLIVRVCCFSFKNSHCKSRFHLSLPLLASDGLIFCDGGSVTLTASSAGFTGGTYTWSNGSTSNPLVVTTGGTYSVTYKSADECTAPVSASLVIIVNPIPPQPRVAASGPLEFCDGGSVSLTASTAGFTGGAYTWSDGSTSNPLVVTTSGTFTVTYICLP